MRLLLCAGLAALLGACATATAPKAAVSPDLAPPPAAPPEPTCPAEEPPSSEDAPALLGATIARVCVLGVGDAERLQVEQAVAPRVGQPLAAEAIATDLENLARGGFIREARAIAQPLGPGRVVLTFVVSPYPLVGTVAFEGAEHGEADALRDLGLKTAWASPYALRKVSARMVELYQRRGYALAAVEPKTAAPLAGRVDVVFVVTEGPLTTVSSLRFAGNKRLKEADLKKALRSAVKAPWREATSAADEVALTALYLDRGMVNARVVASTSPGRSPGDLEVLFTITEGDVFSFGTLSLKGLSLGAEREVLKTLESRPGAVFSRAVLQRDLERLRARGADQGVRVEVLPLTEVDPEKKRIDVTLEVQKQAGGPLKF